MPSKNRWFSRYVIAAMFLDENKRFLITCSSFCSSTSNRTLQHCYVSLEIGCKPPFERGLVLKLGKHQRSKQRCQDLGWKAHDRAQSLFCVHTLCMNYVTNTFLLVSSSVRSKQLLCFVHGQGQKREQKHTTKKFVEFHNHSPLLTMNKAATLTFRTFDFHFK